MNKPDRIHSSKEFDYPVGFLDTSRINSGVDDPYQNGRMTHTAKLDDVDEKEEIENNSDIKPSKKSKKKKAEDPNDKVAHVKKIAKFLLIHVGIFLLVITYAVAGAFLFQLLEQHQEIQNCQLAQGKTQEIVKDYRSQLVNYILFNITTNPLDNSTGKDPSKVYNPKITGMLKDLRDSYLEYYSKYKYAGQDCEKQSLWVFSSAFLFAMTVVTTIGYGHIAPTTWEGQIVCICYATVGIPLFLMGVANISSILSDISRFLYGALVTFLSSFVKRKNKDDEETNESEKQNKENPNEENEKKIEGIISNKSDKSKLSSSKQNLSDDKNEPVEAVDEDDEEEEEDEDKVSVPLFLIFIIFGSYLYIGSAIFSNIETWTEIQSAYFSYVSLSTMGFGDLVPGLGPITSGDYSKGSRNLIIATFYIVIGMALLAMCFELIQDQIVNKVKHISQLLGIHTEEDEKKDNEDDIEVIEDKDKEEEEQKQNQVVPKSAIISYDENLEVEDVENNQNDYMRYEPTASASSNKSQIFKTEREHINTTKLMVKSAITKKDHSRKNSESNC